MVSRATCFHGLYQNVYLVGGRNLLVIVFFLDFAVFSIDHDEYGIVQPDQFHSPIISDYMMPVRLPKLNFNISFKDILQGIKHCFSMHYLIMTGLQSITERLLMLPLTD